MAEANSSEGVVDGVETGTPKRKKKPIGFLVLALALMGGGFYAYRSWTFSSAHVVTDDAYVTASVVPVSARVLGNADRILVKENQRVQAGDLLVTLDGAAYQVEVDRAAADLAMAKAALKARPLASAYPRTPAPPKSPRPKAASPRRRGKSVPPSRAFSKPVRSLRPRRRVSPPPWRTSPPRPPRSAPASPPGCAPSSK